MPGATSRDTASESKREGIADLRKKRLAIITNPC
jgi:hypothetical protein